MGALRGVDRVAIDPTTHRLGFRRFAVCVNRSPVALLLNYMRTSGRTVEDVVDAFEEAAGRAPEMALSLEDVRAALAYGAVLAREEKLPAPSAAGFGEWLPAGVSMEDVEANAATVLGELAAGTTREEVLARHAGGSEELLATVFAYADSLVRNDRLAVSEEPPEERFLRDLLIEHDGVLVEAFSLYWEQTRTIWIPEWGFEKWQRLVEEVERGATGTDDAEYGLDLRARDGLEEWLSVLSPTSKERWLDLIMPLDKRFERATRYVAQPTLWRPSSKPRRWWWYRVPVEQIPPEPTRTCS